MDTSEDDVIIIDESDSTSSEQTPEKPKSERKILNVQIPGEKPSSSDEPGLVLTGDESTGGKSEKEEVEDDTGLDSEQDDPTGNKISDEFKKYFKKPFFLPSCVILQVWKALHFRVGCRMIN